MLKIEKIKKSSEFRQISQNCRKFHAKNLLILSAPTPERYLNQNKSCRFGITASKKVGNAIKRNRAKRQLRAAFTEIAPKYTKNHQDYIIIAKKSIATTKFTQIIKDLEFCLKRIHKN